MPCKLYTVTHIPTSQPNLTDHHKTNWAYWDTCCWHHKQPLQYIATYIYSVLHTLHHRHRLTCLLSMMMPMGGAAAIHYGQTDCLGRGFLHDVYNSFSRAPTHVHPANLTPILMRLGTGRNQARNTRWVSWSCLLVGRVVEVRPRQAQCALLPTWGDQPVPKIKS